ncbi:hypothetical protein TL16_g01240 [Triparma laevis f. inornata]|uniref:Protein-S-isoprenylcysteine O-methyltransferase n=1 Tax=Triparma laevis f. inornata TaxID=1714386 RepID=A0A9W6ZHV5_9STRA|nr:hypothetical protein TL16_g01240 [Triparma laevis f. inornata]
MSVSTLRAHLTKFQSFLSFEPTSNLAFLSPTSPARSGFLGLLLGSLLTFHTLLPFLFPSSHIYYPLILKWSLYMFFLLLFHILEYVVTALYNGRVVSSTSFLIDHSESYTIAALVSWTEYWLTSLLFGPSPLSPLNTLGLLLCLLGQSLRSAALYTCADNFNHIIQDTKNNANPKQRLVREGVYGVLRHPSYTGWFYWSIGTQVRFNFQFNLQSSNVLVRANLFLT